MMSRSTLPRGVVTSLATALTVGGVMFGAHLVAAGHPATTHHAAVAPAAAQTATSTSFSFVSKAGDYIGQGKTSTYKPSTSTTVSITGTKAHLSVAVSTATENWSVDLSPGTGDTLRLGTFSGAERDSFKTGRSPGLDMNGDGRGCNTVYGNFTVNQIGFTTSGAVNLADITFNQHCESSTAPLLTGTIHLNQLPLSYKQVSDTGDYIGGGVSKTYLNSTSLISVSGTGSGLQFTANGLRDDWTGIINAPTGQTLTAGKTYPADDSGSSTTARLYVFGDGRSCDATSGTVTVNAITLNTSGAITNISATFVQHCENGTPALTGTLHYFD